MKLVEMTVTVTLQACSVIGLFQGWHEYSHSKMGLGVLVLGRLASRPMAAGDAPTEGGWLGNGRSLPL